jgi:hypothetical protein
MLGPGKWSEENFEPAFFFKPMKPLHFFDTLSSDLPWDIYTIEGFEWLLYTLQRTFLHLAENLSYVWFGQCVASIHNFVFVVDTDKLFAAIVDLITKKLSYAFATCKDNSGIYDAFLYNFFSGKNGNQSTKMDSPSP